MEGGFAHNPPGVDPIGSLGKSLEDTLEIKVVREDDTEYEPGEIGELISRNVVGKTKFEYHNDPEASRGQNPRRLGPFRRHGPSG